MLDSLQRNTSSGRDSATRIKRRARTGQAIHTLLCSQAHDAANPDSVPMTRPATWGKRPTLRDCHPVRVDQAVRSMA